jgi:predicted outer membrane protein
VKSVRIVLLTLAALAAACSREGSSGSGKKTAAPAFTQEAFLKTALQTTLSAADLGASAAKKGHGPELRALGAAMQAEQSQLRASLAPLAQKKGVAVTNDIETRKAALKDNLNQLVWPQFDRAYSLATVQDMNAEVAAFTTAASKGDAEVKAFADRWLPVLRARQSVSVDLLNKLGGSPFGYPP